MDQLLVMFVCLYHAPYGYEVGMLKVPAICFNDYNICLGSEGRSSLLHSIIEIEICIIYFLPINNVRSDNM